MNSLAFLQARMGSRRLPGKAMIRIEGKTILRRAVERLKAARKIREVVVLTTELGEDDVIVQEALASGAMVYRGSREDVLLRFSGAAEQFYPDIVVRATADNPLIDIGSVDRILSALMAEGLEYCMETDLPVGAATEAVTRPALDRVTATAVTPEHREHVTLYIKENLSQFRARFLAPPDYLRRPEIRITVDTPADLSFVESLIRSVPESDHPIPLRNYLEKAGGKTAPNSKAL